MLGVVFSSQLASCRSKLKLFLPGDLLVMPGDWSNRSAKVASSAVWCCRVDLAAITMLWSCTSRMVLQYMLGLTQLQTVVSKQYHSDLAVR